MKRDHQPVAPRATPLNQKAATTSTPKPSTLEKLELELDDQATHVHRIPKELINRMREREQEREQAKRQEEEIPPSHEQEVPSDDFSGMSQVSDDRTAVFRPPPELLARAKRMRPPAKPNPQSEAPTKPPPAPVGDEAVAGPAIPGAPMMPVMSPVSSAPVARSTPMVPAGARQAPMTPMAPKPALTPMAAKAPMTPMTPMPARVAFTPTAANAPMTPVAPTASRTAPEAPVARSSPATLAARPVDDAAPASAPGSSPLARPVAALESVEALAPAVAPASPLATDDSSPVPLLVEPAATPEVEADAEPEPAAPRSEVAPSSADLATAFSTDASAESSSPSSSAGRTLVVSEAPPGLRASLARWVVAFLVAAAVGTSLIVWLRR